MNIPITLGFRPNAFDMQQFARLRDHVKRRDPWCDKSDCLRVAIALAIQHFEGPADADAA